MKEWSKGKKKHKNHFLSYAFSFPSQHSKCKKKPKIAITYTHTLTLKLHKLELHYIPLNCPNLPASKKFIKPACNKNKCKELLKKKKDKKKQI